MDGQRLRRVLGDPALKRLVERLVQRLEHGRPLTGPVRLERPSEAERTAVARLLGRRPGRGSSLSVPLEALEEALRRAGLADDLRSAVEAVAGPVVPRAERQAAESARRRAALTRARRSRHAGEPWFQEWLEGIATDGTLTRLLGRGEDDLLGRAAAVLDLLPADTLPLPVLAERATGDTKALSRGPLAGLVLRALALRAALPVPRTRLAERELWETAGVVVDDLASQVLVLGLTATGSPLGEWLTGAAASRVPFRITLHQLITMPITVTSPAVWVCENPSVLRATVTVPTDAALICTEGIPSAACHRLLSHCAGRPVHWRGDFDWTGLRTTAMALDRYGAVPWRMSTADYNSALAAGDSEPLRGTPSSSPWDPSLATRMHETGRAVMEERLIPALLTDLTA